MNKRFLLTFFLFLTLLTFTLSAASCSSSTTTPPTTSTTTSSTPTATSTTTTGPILTSDLEDLSPVVSAVRPSVVAINVQATQSGVFGPSTVQAAGTGWIYDTQGHIVTNNHVVANADNITVTLEDGRTFQAAKVSTDAVTDLAVVKINATNLVAASTGDSGKLLVGNWVVAIGNSLDMGISATAGIVSALDITLQESAGTTLHGLIQTDAAINPGNSGGPLVNGAGEVIGINSVKVSQVGVEGMGYAISINEALPIIQTLISQGFVVRPYMGINTTAVTPSLAAFYGLPVDHGAAITSIVTGGPADKAGLKTGDIIVAIGGKTINTMSDLTTVINSFSVGQTVTVDFYRGQTKMNVQLTFAQYPQS